MRCWAVTVGLWRRWQTKRKQEICTSTTWGYAALSLFFFLSIYPSSLSFHPFVCLSFVHLSSVRHQLFTRSRWIFQRVPNSLPLYLHPLVPVSVLSLSSLCLFFFLFSPLSHLPLPLCLLWLCHHHCIYRCVCVCVCGADSSPETWCDFGLMLWTPLSAAPGHHL